LTSKITHFFISALLSLGLMSCFFNADKHQEQFEIADAVSALTADIGSGDIRVTGSDDGPVRVTAAVTGASNHLAHLLSAGELQLYLDCEQHSECGADVMVTIPREVALDLETGSGDMFIQGIHGNSLLRTGSGDIAGSAMVASTLTASTGSGDVDLDLDEPPLRVKVTTGSGDATLRLPSGGYQIEVSTGSGDRSISGVTNDPSAEGSISVKTGSGDARIRGK
jgi:hypothetical protein